MSKNEIIEQIAKERFVEQIAQKYEVDLRDDLVQGVYLYLLKMPEEKVVQLFANNELKYYIAATVRLQAISKDGYHLRAIRRCGLPGQISNIYDNLDILDDDETINIDDVVDEYLNSIPEMEKDALELLLVRPRDRMPYIKKYLEKYNISLAEWKANLPKIKYRFFKHFEKDFKKYKVLKRDNAVVQMTKYGKVIQIFNSAEEAADKLGLKAKYIMRVCRGERKFYQKFRFRYLRDDFSE